LEPLRVARRLGLVAIERTFLLDSAALQTASHSIEQFVPHALEVLPAVIARKWRLDFWNSAPVQQ
jgi:glycerol-3-phosphate responsive antiterminator